MIGESVAFMVMKLTTPFIMNQIGLISDETFQKIDDLEWQPPAGFALEDVVTGVNTATENSSR